MLRKLSFVLIFAILLSACGASAPAEDGLEDAVVASAAETIAPAGGEDLETTEAAGECSEAEYFRINQYSNAMENDDGVTLVYENYAQAEFVSQDPARTQWVSEILSGIRRDFQVDSENLHTYADEFVAEWGTDGFYSYSNYQQLGVARHDEAVVSLISLSSLYSGGSHPNSVQTAYNLDISGQRLLHLEDVILEEAAPELAKLVRARVDEKFTMIDGGNGLFEDYGDIIDNSMVYGNMTPYWYMNNEGLVIFYNQYELGPYAAGIIKAELPYADLEGILLEEYFPAPGDGQSGDLCLRWEGEDGHRIPITLGQEGGNLLVGVIGTVYQVQISEVMWMEDMPIAQELLFSALSLGENDILELTGVYHDETSSFVIEFTDGRGVQHLYHIQEGDLTDDRN